MNIDDVLVRRIVDQMTEAINRADASLDAAVRVIDNRPADDLLTFIALTDSTIPAEVWLARALGYVSALDVFERRDHTQYARAFATHNALQEVLTERSRLRDLVMAARGRG